MRSAPDLFVAMSAGRARRPEFWRAYSLVFIPAAGLCLAALFADRGYERGAMFACAALWGLAWVVPVTIAMARRFHDLGHTGRWAAPQLAALFLALALAVGYEAVAPGPKFPSGCASRLLLSLNRDGTLAPGLERSEAARAACDAHRAASDAHEARRDTTIVAAFWFFGLVHLGTLGVLATPSQHGPNRYGPAGGAS